MNMSPERWHSPRHGECAPPLLCMVFRFFLGLLFALEQKTYRRRQRTMSRQVLCLAFAFASSPGMFIWGRGGGHHPPPLEEDVPSIIQRANHVEEVHGRCVKNFSIQPGK